MLSYYLTFLVVLSLMYFRAREFGGRNRRLACIFALTLLFIQNVLKKAFANITNSEGEKCQENFLHKNLKTYGLSCCFKQFCLLSF